MAPERYYIGIDVGTGSVRAALVKHDGILVASSTQETQTWRDPSDHHIFEQSTTDIWARITDAVRIVLKESGVAAVDVKGIGFDATCSLAVTDFNGNPVTVTRGSDLGKGGERNIVLWADHRAEKEADFINSEPSVVLDYVGGTMSLEMEVPKILWLKNNMPASDFSLAQFYDLPDYLTYRATGARTRSICSITCKTAYVPTQGWNAEFFSRIGLATLAENGYAQLGAVEAAGGVATAGVPVGKGLSVQAAKELGLLEGTPVGSAVIDAYAGWVGTIAARHDEGNGGLSAPVAFEESGHRLAACAGTSTCHIVQSRKGVFVKGVWGPYKDPIFPGWWMNEGGQSSTGQLIDFIITTHPAYAELKERAAKQQANIHEVLRQIMDEVKRAEGAGSWTETIKDMHLYPDLHGNRSPIADPRMRGSIMGLTLNDSLQDLARKYALTLEAVSLQTRHILDALNGAGHSITSIYMSGSQAQNAALTQLFADACEVPIVLPRMSSAAVVLGAAMLGRFAAEYNTIAINERSERLWKIMEEMTPHATIVKPAAVGKEQKILKAKYKIFLESIQIQQRWRAEIEVAAQ
ncbi:Pentulose kinase [Auriscalpium vulgare]|uniref:Pentulose kinase n=1 Tax=Auriscalpium vulgare TaxID=40419 RepID=A0ACB8S8Z4_9AGAM|nr:Pentulose kinase [Auriscalpium vulgare]